MLSESAKAILEKQGYRIVGQHSAVKTCGWTKTMIRGRGGCYKLKFYGIKSHQCLQMTTSMSCANRCIFCWRGYKAPVSKEWRWAIDDPEIILKESIAAHHALLVGFKGNEKANKQLYEQSTSVRHVALSLTGEPITYPRINELITAFHEREISTFLVTNATYPEQLRALTPVTQLYLSIDAPNKELLKKVDVPLFDDFWERQQASLDILRTRKERTCIRLTIIRGLNDTQPEAYAALIKQGDPDFIEVKGYMHVGASQKRLTRDHMPDHAEVLAFARRVAAQLPDWELVSEHQPSRVVMLAKKSFREDSWHTWIDFQRFFALAKEGRVDAQAYKRETPRTGIETIDERTDEREFWASINDDEELI